MNTPDAYAQPVAPGLLRRPFVAYADGSGTIATMPSGCGVAIYAPGDVELLAEASWFTGPGSNNHAELMAVRVALWLTELPPFAGHPLIIRTDSAYTIQAVTREDEPMPWKPNAALILATRALMVGRPVALEHVRGHAGIPGNERADKLAGMARRRGVRAAEARARLAL